MSTPDTNESSSNNGADRESYIIEIVQAGPQYRFGINEDKAFPGVYWDQACMEIEGQFQHPEELRGRRVNLELRGCRIITLQLNEPDYIDAIPGRVGHLEVGPDRISYRGSLPQDAVFALSNWVAIGACKLVSLRGMPLEWGRAKIHTIEFRPKSIVGKAQIG